MNIQDKLEGCGEAYQHTIIFDFILLNIFFPEQLQEI